MAGIRERPPPTSDLKSLSRFCSVAPT